MVRTSKDEAEASRAEAENEGLQERDRPLTCFDFGCTCWLCGNNYYCDYCLVIGVNEERLELFKDK